MIKEKYNPQKEIEKLFDKHGITTTKVYVKLLDASKERPELLNLFHSRLMDFIKTGDEVDCLDVAGYKVEVRRELDKEIGKDCLKILEDPDLFGLIVDRELEKKITGENQSRKAIFLSLCSVWIEDMNIPLNTLISSVSSAGKSYVCQKITELFPEDLVIYRSKISGEAFTYWHVNEDEWTWDGKILVLEDIGQSVLDSPTFRVMCSDGSVATVVRNQRAVDLIVNGKPCILITTASTNPSKEILNRFNIVQLDESAKQTEAVAYNEALESKNEKYDPMITQALGLLKRRQVIVPFALDMQKYITKHYSWEDVRMRRDFSRLRDLIKCSAVLHQFQRKEQDGKLIATKQDYEIARECINYIQTMTLKGLVHKLRKIYEACVKEREFTAKEIHATHPIVSLQMWYKYLDDLCERGLLDTELREREGVKQKVTFYTVRKGTSLSLPEFEQLKQLKQIKYKTASEQPGINPNNKIISQGSSLKVLKVLKDNDKTTSQKYEVISDTESFVNLDESAEPAHKTGEIIELEKQVADILIADKKLTCSNEQKHLYTSVITED